MATDLIFDFFGTLVSYTEGLFRGENCPATCTILRDSGFPLESHVFISEFTRVSAELEASARQTHEEFHMHDLGRAFFSACFDRQPSAAVLELFVDTFIAEWNSRTVLYPSIAALLDRLAQRYRLSIISNTHYTPVITRNLEAMGVTDRFAQVVTSVELGIRKPDPRIFQAALNGLGIPASSAIYVGDTYEDDYQGATAVGMRAILIDPERRWADVLTDRVDHLFELDRLLD